LDELWWSIRDFNSVRVREEKKGLVEGVSRGDEAIKFLYRYS
jgi:hypothetical protein